MTSERGSTDPLSVLVAPLACLAVLALAAALSIAPVSTNDLWIHLETGERVLAEGSVPDKDPYSFTASDRDYLAHEWLAGVLFQLVYRIGGTTGLILFKTTVVLAGWLPLLALCRMRRDRYAVVLIVLGTMGYIAAARYLVRPHIFTFLLSAWMLWLLFGYRDGDRRGIRLFLTLPVVTLWANLHGGFVLGIAILSAFAAGETLNWLRERVASAHGTDRPPGADRSRTLNGSELTRVLALPPLALLAAMVNPYGARILLFPFELTGTEVFMSEVYEWQPPFADVFDSTLTFFLYWGWVCVLFASFFVTGDRGSRHGLRGLVHVISLAALGLFAYAFVFWQQMLISTWPIWVGLALVFCLANLRQIDLTDVALVALAFGLSMRHNRAIADAVVLTLPVLTRNVSRIIDRLSQPRRGRSDAIPLPAPGSGHSRPGTVIAASVLLLAVSAHAATVGYVFAPGHVRQRGLGLAETVPACGADWLGRQQIRGNAYATYQVAAILIHRLSPEVKVNMDSRNDVYGAELFREYRASRRSYDALRDYLARWPVDFFFLNIADLAPAILRRLLDGGEWVQVYFDHQVIVLVAARPENAELIARHAYRHVFPTIDRNLRVPENEAREYLEEANRAAAACSESWLPDWYRAQALAWLGRDGEAVEAAREVVAERIGNPWFVWALLGQLHARQQDLPRAVEAYERAVALRPGDRGLRQRLRRLRGD